MSSFMKIREPFSLRPFRMIAEGHYLPVMQQKQKQKLREYANLEYGSRQVEQNTLRLVTVLNNDKHASLHVLVH